MKQLPPRPVDPVADALPELRNFSLVLGGPLYQLIRRRMFVICGIIWLPLLVLCAFKGTLTSGVKIPFLSDVETHARFLLAVPMMLPAEFVEHQRLRGIVAQFAERKHVPERSLDQLLDRIVGAVF